MMKNWVWKFYLLFLFFFTAKKAVLLFWPQSPEFLFYFILYGFDFSFFWNYFLAMNQVLLTILQWFGVFFFVYQMRFLSVDFWKIVFIIKIPFDMAGNSYHLLQLTALYKASPLLCFLMFAHKTAIYIPAFWALYLYAFHQEKVFRQVL